MYFYEQIEFPEDFNLLGDAPTILPLEPPPMDQNTDTALTQALWLSRFAANPPTPASIARRLGVSAQAARQRLQELTSRDLMSKPTLGPAEVGAVLGLTDSAVRWHCRQGRLGRRAGPRAYVIDAEELRVLLESPPDWLSHPAGAA